MKKLREYIFRSYLDEGETIFFVARRHIIFLKIETGKPFMLGVLTPIVVYFIFQFPIVLLVSLVWGVVGLVAVFYHFLNWYYCCWLITNLGVIAIKREGIFNISTQRMDYHLIDDISYTVKGVAQMILNYGDITIDKMVANSSMTLQNTPNPKRLERTINKYREMFIARRSIRDHVKLQEMLSEMIAYHASSGKINNPESE